MTLVSMILYHGVWDLVYIFGIPWNWFSTEISFYWQQSICWTFILLSGFCWSLGRHQLRRGLTVFGGGVLVTAVTLAFLPEQRIIFGVLTLLGSGMLLLIPAQRVLKHIPAWGGLAGSAALFVLARWINQGWLGLWFCPLLSLPDEWYTGYFMTFLGFLDPDFYSSDYFSLIPWLFLFLVGYFLFRLGEEKGMPPWLRWEGGRPLAFLGRHSMVIYLVHQPVIYGLLWLLLGR